MGERQESALAADFFFLQVSFSLQVFRIGERPRFLFLIHERPRIDRPRNIGEATKKKLSNNK
jgi:hypothetical protein